MDAIGSAALSRPTALIGGGGLVGTATDYHRFIETAFWVDPVEEITGLFLTQLLPSGTHPIRSELSQLVYQALVD